MARILVTGGNGIIGRHAVRTLRDGGHDVHVISRKLQDQPNIHQADILDINSITELLQELRPDWLLHLAWETENSTYWHSPNNLDYVAATLQMAKSFSELGGKRFVGAGTCAEYSWDEDTISEPLDEIRSETAPHTLYGQAKLATFQLLEKYFATTETSFAWGRLFLLYGPGEQEKRLCPDVICNLLRGHEVKCSSGKQVRDFMHTSDAGRAFAALLNTDVQGPVNIATGSPMPLADFTREIGYIIGSPELIKLGALTDRPDDPTQLVPLTNRLEREVGFKCLQTLRSGLQNTIDWWQHSSDSRK